MESRFVMPAVSAFSAAGLITAEDSQPFRFARVQQPLPPKSPTSSWVNDADVHAGAVHAPSFPWERPALSPGSAQLPPAAPAGPSGPGLTAAVTAAVHGLRASRSATRVCRHSGNSSGSVSVSVLLSRV